jgi:hypothetical protein
MTRHHEVFRSCTCRVLLVVLVALQMLAVWRSTLGVSLYVSEPTETKVLVRSPALLEDGGGLSALTFTQCQASVVDVTHGGHGVVL